MIHCQTHPSLVEILEKQPQDLKGTWFIKFHYPLQLLRAFVNTAQEKEVDFNPYSL